MKGAFGTGVYKPIPNKKAAPKLERLFSPFFCKKYLETR
jgi:hypothetical protein